MATKKRTKDKTTLKTLKKWDKQLGRTLITILKIDMLQGCNVKNAVPVLKLKKISTCFGLVQDVKLRNNQLLNLLEFFFTSRC